MADNFDMKQFLTENKLRPYARLKENKEEAFGGINETIDFTTWKVLKGPGGMVFQMKGPNDGIIDARVNKTGQVTLDGERPEGIDAIKQIAKQFGTKTTVVYGDGLSTVITKADLKTLFSGINESKKSKEADLKNEVSTDEIPFSPKVKAFIDKAIKDAKEDGEFEYLIDVDYFDNDLIDFIIDEFDDDNDYDDVSQEVKDYISKAISGKKVNENLTPTQHQLIQNIVDNWTDEGIDAEPAMERINKILMGDMSDEELDDDDLVGINEEAKTPVSKEQKIQVIKEWIWYTCDEGKTKGDINKYNKMVDMYFADKNDVTKEDFKKIWAKVTEKYGVGDAGADSEAFPETWRDVQRGKLVNPSMKYEGKHN